MEKTQAFIIGKHIKFKETYNLKWCTGSIKLLGLSICNTEQENYIQNFEPKIKKIKSLFKIWKQRHLSLKGKITIINSLAASMLVYPCTCLQTPDRVLREINQLFFDFLWDNGSSKIARTTIIKQINEGGLKMIEFETKVKTLKLTWFRRALINPKSPWILIINELLKNIPFDYLIRCKSDCSQYLNNVPKCYREIYKTWKQIKKPESNTKSEILQENLWLNENITVESKPIFWSLWFMKGIKIIEDVYDSEGNFITMTDLKHKYGLECNFIDHLRIRQAIPRIWRQKNQF